MVEPHFYNFEGTKQKWCKFQANANCWKLFTVHYEFREIEGPEKIVVNDGKM
jgi:hypothetical protein